MTKDDRINAFKMLGDFLKNFTLVKDSNSNHPFEIEIQRSQMFNKWFTQSNVRSAIGGICYMLKQENLQNWMNDHLEPLQRKTVAVIMAGNIPIVGFHDFLSVLISGHAIKIKLSKNDNKLFPLIVSELVSINPEFKNLISFSDNNLKDFDAIIATGSNNSKIYFDSYFSSYPSLIRGNRTSVAILNGQESLQERKGLAKDIFSYFGLGCRSVTKLFLPRDYDLNLLFEVFYDYKDIVLNNKYVNNYDYNKAVFLMGNNVIIENGFLILKEENSFLQSPVSVLYYEYYDDMDCLKKDLDSLSEEIQCICGHGYLPFGKTQMPELEDYADGVNTLEFLSKL
jgi:hypothetical protein